MLETQPSFTVAGDARWLGGALVLNQQTVVVTNRDRQQVEFFTSAGTIRHTVGGLGTAPGQFARRSDMRVFRGPVADSIVVTDDGNRRVQIVGAIAGAVTSIDVQGMGRVAGVFGDGTWLVELVLPPPATASGPVEYVIQCWRYDASGRPLSKIASAVSAGRFVNADGKLSSYLIPFISQPAVAPIGDRLWLTRADEPAVDAYAFDGTVAARHVWSLAQRPSDAARRRFEGSIAALPSPDRAVLTTVALAPWLPAYRRMLADDDANLWLERYRLRAEEDQPAIWDVVSPTQGWRGAVTTPAHFDVVSISGGMVLGLTRTDPSAAALHGYRLVR
jgi:hypothetical protein